MLSRFFSTKPDHPLVDPKEVRRIAGAAISNKKPEQALVEITGWFESLAGADGFTPTLRFERIIELAAASLPHARRCAREFLVGTRQSRLQEQQCWQRNSTYWTQLAQALERCMEDAGANPKAADAMQPHRAELLTAMLMAYAGQLYWAQLRHGPINAEFWAKLGYTYLRSVREKTAERRVHPFGLHEEETTLAHEYLKALIFNASSMDNLLPLEIALAERFIAHFLPHFILSTEAFAGSAYWADAGQALPPSRLTKLPAIAPGLRFFGPGTALEAVKKMRTRIAGGAQIDEVNLGGQFPADKLIPVLDHLAMCWSPQPPTRNHVRHRVKSRVNVVSGLVNLRHHLCGAPDVSESIESWAVEDVSLGGIGAALLHLRNDWVRVGTLVGVQPEGHGHWMVGTIRRFMRSSEQRGVVGIETLSKTPRALTASDGGLTTDLVLLDPLQDGSSARALLAPGDWEVGISLTFMVDDKFWRLHPAEMLEAGNDWLIGRYLVELLPV